MNSKKVMRPKSPIIIFFYCFYLLIICSCVAAIPFVFIWMGIYKLWLTISGVISAVLLILLFCNCFVSLITKKITVDENGIYVCKDRGRFFLTVQYSASVAFQNIADLRIIVSTRDSHNQEVFGLFTPMKYLVIDCIDGSQQLFNLYYYSKKQITTILDLIICRAKAVGNSLSYQSSKEILKLSD